MIKGALQSTDVLHKECSLAVLRDLASERSRSMDRYADELVAMAQCNQTFAVSDQVLPEPLMQPVVTSFEKVKRYKRRYVDYPNYASRIDADLFHIADHSYAFLIRSLPPKRTVITCHDLMLLTQDEWADRTIRTPSVPFFRYSVSHLAHAARIVAVSEHTKSDIIRFGLAYPSNIVVVPPPVSPKFSPVDQSTRMQTRLKIGVSMHEVALLHVGTPSPYKNLETVVDVLAELRGRGVPAVLVRVGNPLTTDIEKRASALGVDPWIRDLGHLGDDELANVYASADMLIFPSLKEGFGWPVVEAMASGLPVLASTTQAISESLQGCGLQAEARDVAAFSNNAESLISSQERRKSLVAKGLERAKHFSRESIGDSLKLIYEDLMSKERES